MKVDPIPTSPKVCKKRHKTSGFYAIIILSTFFGFFAGIIGELFLHAYAQNSLKIPFLGKIQFIDNGGVAKEFIIRSKTSEIQNISQDDIARSAPLVVTLYEAKAPQPNNPIDDLYHANDKSGNGVFLSNDGWIATTNKAVHPNKKYIAIQYEGKILSIDTILFDPASDFVLCKSSLANNHVATIVQKQDIKFSEAIYLLDYTTNQIRKDFIHKISNLSTLRESSPFEFAQSSDKLSAHYELTSAVKGISNGTPAFNAKGNLIGIVQIKDDDAKILPLYFIASQLENLIKKKLFFRSSLGLEYMMVQNEKNGAFELQQKGAYITKINADSTEKTDNTALAKGDIVTRINSIEINDNHPLNETLQSFQPREKMSISFIRGKEEKTTITEPEAMR